MAQKIDFSDKDKFPIILQHLEIDDSTSLSLVGKGVLGYGDYINENFLHLLERFSSQTEPRHPTEGTIWYNSSTHQFLVYTSNELWKPLNGITINSSDPISDPTNTIGDLWLNQATGRLFVFMNGVWVVLNNVDETTKWIPNVRRDITGGFHSTLELVINSITIMILSSSPVSWIPHSSELLYNTNISMVSVFPNIHFSINLINRRIIPDIIAEIGLPVTDIYTREGDIWTDYQSKDIYIFVNNTWRRLSNKINISTSSPTNTSGELDDMWIDINNKQVYYFNTITSSWELLLNNTIFSDNPPTNSSPLPGTYWIEVPKEKLYVYTGENWYELTSTDKNNLFKRIVRNDNNIPPQSHEVLEGWAHNNPVIALSSEVESWSPFDSEPATSNLLYRSFFNNIYPGLNINKFINAHGVASNIVATQEQAETGLANDVVMTPLRSKQYADFAIQASSIITDPSQVNTPVESGTFVNYYYEDGYENDSDFPIPNNDFNQYLETVLLGNHGEIVRLNFAIGWSNWISSGTPMLLEYRIRKMKEDGSESKVVLSGTLNPTIATADANPLNIIDTNVLRRRRDVKITSFVMEKNTTDPEERMKYTLELRRQVGGGSSFIYFGWMTVSHYNNTVAINTLPVVPIVSEWDQFSGLFA